MNPVYSVIIPVFNEVEVITASYNELKNIMDTTEEAYELIFVNDGSTDNSFHILSQIAEKDKNIKIIDLSRNFGQQIAVFAGIDFALGKAVAIIDADLQDPPEIILKMIAKWQEGFDVVYGKRISRQGEGFFKKFTAKLYYRMLKSISNINIPIDAGDFRLMDKKVCKAIKLMKEKNPYIRGIVSWVGYKQTYVEYHRNKRLAGKTKYSLKQMLKLGTDGIFSFSTVLLKLISFLGFFTCISSLIYLLVIFILYFFKGNIEFIHFALFFVFIIQGAILISIGILGEYIGRIYDEAKDRPLYIVSQIICKEENR